MTSEPRGAAPGTDDQERRPTPPPPVHRDRRQKQMGWRSQDVLRTAALLAGLYAVLQLLWHARLLVLVAFLGTLLGLAVAAGVDRLERMRIPRGLGAAVIVLSVYGALIGLGAAMAPTLREQGSELRQRLPEAVDKLEAWMNRRQNGIMGVLGGPPVTRPESAAVGARSPTDSAAASLGTDPLRERIGKRVGSASRYVFPVLHSTAEVFAGILLITFLAIYIGADPALYHGGLMRLFPRRSRARAGEVLSATAVVLRRWLVTQAIAMVTIGAVSVVVLLVLHVKAALALGVLAGIFEFIPTVGPILSGVPAVAMGFLDSPEKALWVTGLYVVLHFLEAHVMIPLMMKGGLDIPPALTVVTQALMTLIFGFLGLMTAVPLLAAVLVPIKLLYVEGVVGEPAGLSSTVRAAAQRGAADTRV